MADCYFPPTHITIDALFEFDLGLQKPLGHDLDIVKGAGHLRFTNMSRMNICPDNVLVNKDSITMYMNCAPERRWLVNEDGSKVLLPQDTLEYICNRTELLKDRVVNDTRNTIIVNNMAGLVLDSGSVTHIGNGSTILIRPGGTLLIKSGATVIIGDSDCVNNRGELLADHGSYVCIEEGAILKFYNDIDSLNFYYTDTLDRHLVYIAMPQSGQTGAVAGKNPLGGRGKFTNGDNGIWAGGTCIPFCDLVEKNPPYGVDNREFGWFNVGLPRALYYSEDTVCIGRAFAIDATPSLNETGYSIMVCSYDTTNSICDSTIVDITEAGDFCLGKRYLFTPTQSGHYKVQLIVTNDCNVTDTFSKLVHVPKLPVAYFTTPDSICPGIGVLHANGALSASNINTCKHRWTVEPLYDDSTDIEALYAEDLVSKDWNIDTLTGVSSDFTFPGYNFIGGMRYTVSLQIRGWCGDSIYSQVVSVPLKVSIDIDDATSYQNPVGPTPINLIGSVSGATSWNWSPTTYLSPSNSLTTTATPPDSIQYILTGISTSCIARDTIIIRKNKVSYAGYDTSICYGGCLVLGTNFNAAVFLGYINYASNGALSSIYAAYPGLKFDKHFTGFMIKQLSTYNSSPLISTFIGIDSTRKYIQSRGWFANYYTTFVSSSASISSLNTFVTEVNNDLFIKHKLDSVNAKGKWNASIVNQIFNAYKTYYNTAQYNNLKTLWEQHPDTSSTWVTRTDGTDYFNLKICGTQNIVSRIRVTDNILGRVEYDEVLITVDSVIAPDFEVFYQEDSTAYLLNQTDPFSSYYSYLWTFGDGDSSITQNPIHTFPAFDSSYRVCLYVTNSCGTYQYCDTVYIDSLGLSGGGFGKTDLSIEQNPTDDSEEDSPQMKSITGVVLLDNQPNPFSEETLISYFFEVKYSSASLRITDVLGRTIKKISLDSPKGKVLYNASSQSSGIYYVSLIIDGMIVKSKPVLIGN